MARRVVGQWVVGALKSGRRGFHTSLPRQLLNPSKVEEVKIPVPWGHIAGKWWGDKSVAPVIALHGFLDNAASFDRLAPLISAPSFLSLDLPGHGRSFHFPRGVVFHYFDHLVVLRYLLKTHLKLDRLTFIGHSFGSTLALVYSALFPQDVAKFISLDCPRFYLAKRVSRLIEIHRETVATYSACLDDSQPYCSEEELLTQMVERRRNYLPLSAEFCKILLRRGSLPLDGNSALLKLSHDPKLSAGHVGVLTKDLVFHLASRVRCMTLHIYASQGVLKGEELQDYLESVRLMADSGSPYVKALCCTGDHHLHLTSPHSVSDQINQFLRV